MEINGAIHTQKKDESKQVRELFSCPLILVQGYRWPDPLPEALGTRWDSSWIRHPSITGALTPSTHTDCSPIQLACTSLGCEGNQSTKEQPQRHGGNTLTAQRLRRWPGISFPPHPLPINFATKRHYSKICLLDFPKANKMEILPMIATTTDPTIIFPTPLAKAVSFVSYFYMTAGAFFFQLNVSQATSEVTAFSLICLTGFPTIQLLSLKPIPVSLGLP